MEHSNEQAIPLPGPDNLSMPVFEPSPVCSRTRLRTQAKNANPQILEQALDSLLALQASESDKCVSQHTAKLQRVLEAKTKSNIPRPVVTPNVSPRPPSVTTQEPGAVKKKPSSPRLSPSPVSGEHSKTIVSSPPAIQPVVSRPMSTSNVSSPAKKQTPSPSRATRSETVSPAEASSSKPSGRSIWDSSTNVEPDLAALFPGVTVTRPPNIKPFSKKSFAEIATSVLLKEDPKKCEYCEKPFSSEEGLAQHLVDVHFKDAFTPSNTGKSRKIQRKKLFECPECGRVFFFERSLQKHDCFASILHKSLVFRSSNHNPVPETKKTKNHAERAKHQKTKKEKIVVGADGWRTIPVKKPKKDNVPLTQHVDKKNPVAANTVATSSNAVRRPPPMVTTKKNGPLPSQRPTTSRDTATPPAAMTAINASQVAGNNTCHLCPHVSNSNKGLRALLLQRHKVQVNRRNNDPSQEESPTRPATRPHRDDGTPSPRQADREPPRSPSGNTVPRVESQITGC